MPAIVPKPFTVNAEDFADPSESAGLGSAPEAHGGTSEPTQNRSGKLAPPLPERSTALAILLGTFIEGAQTTPTGPTASLFDLQAGKVGAPSGGSKKLDGAAREMHRLFHQIQTAGPDASPALRTNFTSAVTAYLTAWMPNLGVQAPHVGEAVARALMDASPVG